MNTIISKRPSPFIYTKWSEHSVNGAFVEEYSILVNGGAGVMGGADFLSGKKQDNFNLFTPEGVATLVDDDTLEKLMGVNQFVKDIERGLIKVINGKSIKDQEKIDSIATKGDMMDSNDIGCRQLTEQDFKDAGAIKQRDGSWNVAESSGAVHPRRKTNKKGRR